MQIRCFLANFANFISKFILFVNRINPLRKYGSAFGITCVVLIVCFYFQYEIQSKNKIFFILIFVPVRCSEFVELIAATFAQAYSAGLHQW